MSALERLGRLVLDALRRRDGEMGRLRERVADLESRLASLEADR